MGSIDIDWIDKQIDKVIIFNKLKNKEMIYRKEVKILYTSNFKEYNKEKTLDITLKYKYEYDKFIAYKYVPLININIGKNKIYMDICGLTYNGNEFNSFIKFKFYFNKAKFLALR